MGPDRRPGNTSEATFETDATRSTQVPGDTDFADPIFCRPSHVRYQRAKSKWRRGEAFLVIATGSAFSGLHVLVVGER